IDRLLTIASKDLSVYSRKALANRRRTSDLTAEKIDAFVSGAFEPKAEDFRAIRKQVGAQRKIYKVRYQDVRDKVFAHNEVGGIEEANQLRAKTSADELKSLLEFLSEVHEAIWQLLQNGRKPELRNRPFLLKPIPASPGTPMRPGERIYREGH